MADLLFERSCRGCDDGTPLLAEDGDGRSLHVLEILSGAGRSAPPRRRRLQDDDLCYCNAETIAPRAPSLSEFSVRLEGAIQNAGFVGVCGLSVEDTGNCDETVFSEEFTATMIVTLRLAVGWTMTTDMLAVLEKEFLLAYESVQDDLVLGDSCDPQYRQLSSIVAQRNIFDGGNSLRHR